MTIPHARPSVSSLERMYVNNALDNAEIVVGDYIGLLEERMAEWTGMPHCVAMSSCTTAIQLTVEALGWTGQEVAVPALTFAATGFAVHRAGCHPVILDEDPWQEWEGPAVAVHLLGVPSLFTANPSETIEDCAQAIDMIPARVGLFSLNGNKVCAGGGGILATTDEALASRVRLLANQGYDGETYQHTAIGTNGRLTNLQAAFALAQVERLTQFMEQRRAIAGIYAHYLDGVPGVELVSGPQPWMVAIEVETGAAPVVEALRAKGIGARPFWVPLHRQAPFMHCRAVVDGSADERHFRGMMLPTYHEITEWEIAAVCRAVRAAL